VTESADVFPMSPYAAEGTIFTIRSPLGSSTLLSFKPFVVFVGGTAEESSARALF